jgi:hypothetical protein
MTELNREEINEVLSAMQALFMEKKYSNVAILNALSSMSVHLAFVFGIPKDTYLKDMGIMFEERVERAVEESKNASH